MPSVINRNTLVPLGAAVSVVLGLLAILWGAGSIQAELVGLRVEMQKIGAEVSANSSAVRHLAGAGLVNRSEFAHIHEAITEVKGQLKAIDSRLRAIEMGRGR